MSEYTHKCDHCQRGTNNGRDTDGERLCHECRQIEAKRQAESLYKIRIMLATEKARRLVIRHPSLASRLAKAKDLAMAGHAKRNGTGWLVKSQSGNGTYHVSGNGCDCYDARHNAPEVQDKPACKHQIAVWLVLKAERDGQKPAPRRSISHDPEAPLTREEQFHNDKLARAMDGRPGSSTRRWHNANL